MNGRLSPLLIACLQRALVELAYAAGLVQALGAYDDAVRAERAVTRVEAALTVRIEAPTTP